MTALMVTVGLGGCPAVTKTVGHNTPDAGAGTDAAAPDSPGSFPALDAATHTDLPAVDGGVDGTTDAGTGADVPDPARDFHLLLGSINDAFYGNFSTCFGSRRSLWPSGDFADLPVSFIDTSLQLGLLTIDPGAAQRCLETLRTAECEHLIEIRLRGPLGPGNPALPECAGVLVGQVPPGKACRMNEDCRLPEQYACVGQGTCGRTCTARPARAAGEVCTSSSDRCTGGTVCRYGPTNKYEERCLGPTPQGAACGVDDECVAGLMCAEATATSIGQGTCRPFALGSPCAGNWECAHAYVCAGAGPDRPGTCQVGKPVGATCSIYLQDVNKIQHSDCAVGTWCFDLDGNGPRCNDGAALGAACGTLTGTFSGWLGCLEGYCDRGPRNTLTVGTCQPTKPAGSTCSSRTECTAPNDCLMGREGTLRCGLANQPVALGSPCDITDADVCGAGEYCAPPPDFDLLSPSVTFMGSCARVIPAGQACREHVDLCEGLAECIDGVCKRC